VADATNLSEPNLPQGIFGLITINGERIAYRNRDTTANTVSGLRRGTAGTGAADHAAGSAVYDIGLGNLLPAEYQNRVIAYNFDGNGSQTVFTTTDLNVSFGALEPYDSTPYDSGDINNEPGSFAYGENTPDDFLTVYVGGIQQIGNWTLLDDNPVEIEFNVAPPAGQIVTIEVLRAQSWYQPGLFTASNGVALQETDTLAARFIRGN
jgi:hypothetical protein